MVTSNLYWNSSSLTSVLSALLFSRLQAPRKIPIVYDKSTLVSLLVNIITTYKYQLMVMHASKALLWSMFSSIWFYVTNAFLLLILFPFVIFVFNFDSFLIQYIKVKLESLPSVDIKNFCWKSEMRIMQYANKTLVVWTAALSQVTVAWISAGIQSPAKIRLTWFTWKFQFTKGQVLFLTMFYLQIIFIEISQAHTYMIVNLECSI